MQKRSRLIDILRGILIVLVVAAHYNREFPHDIVFLFHMPLFFIISGFLLNKSKLLNEDGYLFLKVKSLFLPYAIYLLADFLLVQRRLSMIDLIKMIWGGRTIVGVYWYITCYLFSLLIFSALLKKFPDKTSKALILVGQTVRKLDGRPS